MKTQLKNLENICLFNEKRWLQIVMIFVAFFISAVNINPASANPQGTTTVVYLAPGEELHSKDPNSLSVEDGVISIILQDGLRISFDFSGKEIN